MSNSSLIVYVNMHAILIIAKHACILDTIQLSPKLFSILPMRKAYNLNIYEFSLTLPAITIQWRRLSHEN